MVFSSVCAVIPTWELILTCSSLCPEEGVGTSQGPNCCCWVPQHRRAGTSTEPLEEARPHSLPAVPSADGFGALSQASCEQQHPAGLCLSTACCPSAVCIGKWDQSGQAHFPCAEDGFSCWAASAQRLGRAQPCTPSLLPAQSAQRCSQKSPGSAQALSPSRSGASSEGGRWKFHLEDTACARAGVQGAAAA